MPDIIRRKLRLLKRTLRLFAALDGCAAAVTALVVFALFDIALDRTFEFSRLVRFAVLFGSILLFALAVHRWILRRCCAVINDEQLANVFERFVPPLNESLITSVEYEHGAVSELEKDTVFHSLFGQTLNDATTHLQQVNIRRFFHWRYLFRRIFIAAIVSALFAVCLVRFAETSEIWFSRNVLLSEREYPRQSQLVADGFTDGKVRIGRGDSFTLSVRASTAMPLIPDVIRVHVGSKENGQRTLLIDQFREETVDGTNWRVFSHTFAECLESLPLAVRGADSYIDGLEIEVVPPPTLSGISLKQEFPRYMNRPSRTITAAGRTAVPEGTTVTINGTSNKPLRKVNVTIKEEGSEIQNETQNEAVMNPDGTVQFLLQNIQKETALNFQLEDEDGLRNSKPVRLDFSITKDQPPVITATLDGIGTAITPNAVLPANGEITDDYGLDSAAFRYSVEKGVNEENKTVTENLPPMESGNPALSVTVPLTAVQQDTTLSTLQRQVFSVTDCGVLPGDRLSVHIEAADKYDLNGSAGQTGSGPQWSLDIVTPEKLKGLLEVREISLRQRFEVLIGEVEKTKAIIDGFALEPPSELIQQAEASIDSENLSDREPDSVSPASSEKQREEIELRKKNILETITKEQADNGLYHISRMQRDTQKESYETRTITESFRLIRQEMVNNQIFNEDAQQRLDKKIIEPMRTLYDVDFPELERLTKLLNGTLEIQNQPLRPTAIQQRQAVLVQFDVVLKNMAAIRDGMISMESFNEAVELLRTIIKQQQQLRNETQEEKNKRLKDLLN